jgi:hypothetical protein
MYTLEQLQQKTFGELKAIGWELNVLPEGDRRYRENWINAIAGVNPPLLALLEVSPAEVQAQESPIIETVEASPAADKVQAQEPPIESKFGRIVYPRPVQGAIVPVAENSPGVEVDRDEDELPECSTCFGDGYVEDEFGRVKFCQCEPKLSRQKTESAIVQSVEKSPCVDCVYCHSPEYESLRDETYKCYRCKSDHQNPILTGIALSDRFLARYASPQAETLHYEITDGYKVDTGGQLSFFESQVVSEPEPPDPDDFDSLDAFRQAIARWDWEHPTSSFDHCSDLLPSSVHSEPPDPYDFDSMFAFWASDDDSEQSSIDKLPSSIDKLPSSIDKPLEVSLDSFCEWAPCPEDWYEPDTLLEPSKVPELSPVCKSSITSNFFIPTFGSLGDRWNRSDEPPDTGISAKLPKPKPPKFPPQAASQPLVNQVSRNYPETIPELFRVAAGSSTQPARSPPGGDAMS